MLRDVLRPIGLCLACLALMMPIPAAGAGCPERPPCKGCGCRGGPGYRGPDGRCVGFKNLTRVCGTPPTTRCRFENAPGTGLNRDCALGKEANGAKGAGPD
ncbi:hypothetical protein [Ancylobacter mangrovi]|uniref:hypothetical protein n=1 Tax=Ancylobacter mangrovi TaxID=2972472 RepID=UPI002162B9C5|nr:hypothetical protein [Ancylobacter mangrovi]MCS0501903.1 hypothetical protein [Ancylobacter mangrovi]